MSEVTHEVLARLVKRNGATPVAQNLKLVAPPVEVYDCGLSMESERFVFDREYFPDVFAAEALALMEAGVLTPANFGKIGWCPIASKRNMTIPFPGSNWPVSPG